MLKSYIHIKESKKDFKTFGNPFNIQNRVYSTELNF